MLISLDHIEDHNRKARQELRIKGGKSRVQHIFGKGKHILSLDDLEVEQDMHFMSTGSWNSFDLLRYCISHTGPANCLITTWSINSRYINSLRLMKEKGEILNLGVIIDERMAKRRSSTYQRIEKIADRMASLSCHAKVNAVYNNDRCAVMVSSMNFTRNPRVEAGVISTRKSVVDFHTGWMNKTLEHAAL